MTFHSYAQNYEDYFIWRVLEFVSPGFYVDVGANDPDADSVSKAFMERGWQGIEVEPLPHLAQRLREKRPNATIVEAATGASEGSGRLYKFDKPGDGMSTFDLEVAERLSREYKIDFASIDVPIRTLNSILEEHDPAVIHWMKIDVEGFEFQTLSGLDLKKWRPWLLIIEATEAGKPTPNHQEWESIVLAADYKFAYFDGLNRYYVPYEQARLTAALDRPVSVHDDVVSPKDRATADILHATMQERDHLTQAYQMMQEKIAELQIKNEALVLCREIHESVAELRSAVPAELSVLYEKSNETQSIIKRMERRTLHGRLRAVRKSLAALRQPDPSAKLPRDTPPLAEFFPFSFGPNFKHLKGSRRIKAQIAVWALTQFPPKPSSTGFSRRQTRLMKWAVRAYTPRTPASPAILYSPPSPKEQAHSDGVWMPHYSAKKLILSETFGAPLTEWNSFLKQLSTKTAKTVQTGVGRQVLSVISTGAAPRTLGQSAVFDIAYSDHHGLSTKLGELKEQDWLLFTRPEDTIYIDLLDRLADKALIKAQIVLPDLAFVQDGQVHPVLAPGANYAYALNCPLYTSRFLARASAVCAALERGATTADEIALDLLRAAEQSRTPLFAQAIGLPVIETPGGTDTLTRLRADLLQTPDVHLPSPNGPVLSGSVDVGTMGGVSVVICTKDKGFYIRQLVARLLDYPEKIVRDVIIVSNNTTNPHALATLRSISQHDRVTLLRYDSEFNFSAQSNLGAQHACGAHILFLNDDIVPVTDRWLEELMTPFVDSKTVIAGPLLLYPDERVQHAGIFLGHGQVAGHVMAGHRLPDEEFNFLASIPRYVACVTGAVMMVRKADFDAVGGFDTSLRLWIQDIDLCMRMSSADARIILNPRSILFHMESLSVKETLDNSAIGQARARELDHFFRRWPNYRDHDIYHPALLDISALNCRVMHP